ncbi:hypothetical protein [Sphingomonas sp.]|uniref:hypothetical protein n=1 Tax=Sphingomonas sp. TaxID=28214 RepID=UPI0031DAC1EB
MASAAISLGGSLLSGLFGGKSAKKAAQQRAQAIQQAIAEQRRQYDQSRSDFMPFLNAGTGALGQVQGLLGLNGGDIQQQLIDSLKGSPSFTSRFNTGADTILQNAAATGGLRGGNTQSSLANFGSSLLSDVIQQQLGNLGGLVNIGSGTAGDLGSLGQSNANSISALLETFGNAKAGGTLGQGTAWLKGLNGGIAPFQDLAKKWAW